MNITPSRIRKILIRKQSVYIEKRASGLAGYKQGVLDVGTVVVCKLLYLNLRFRNWVGF